MKPSERTIENRKKFIADFTRTVMIACGKDPMTATGIDFTYTNMAVSQCMDSAILYKDILDIGFDDGYRL